MADKKQTLTCSLCLDIYTSPKLLPCYHTFCEQCLVDLASKQSMGTFPCPSCRVETTLPSGGVSAFQTNFYLDPTDLERARNGSMCPQHPKQDVDMFCVRCDLPVCLKCKMVKHEGHQTKSLSEKVSEAKNQLQKSRDWLERRVQDIVQQVELAERQQKAVRAKQAALEANIRDRQAALKAAADIYAKDALASLDKVTKDIWDSLQADLDYLHGNLEQLERSQREVKDVLDNATGLKQIAGAKEWEDGSVNVQFVKKSSRKKIRIQRPVLQVTSPPEAALKHVRDYMGSVAETEMDVPAADVTVQEKFRCRQDPDADVCSLCPLTNGTLYVSYEPYMVSCDIASEIFNAEGKSVDTITFDTRRRTTVARNKNGKFMYANPAKGSVYTYAKKCDSDMIRFFKLHHNTAEKATVCLVTIVSDEPFKTDRSNVFSINCAPQRAFDVDSSEQLFVVLEDGKAPDYQRRVQLYRYSQPDPVAKYNPPVEPWQPSDMCFYKKGNTEVLLVADELNDIIHVIKVEQTVDLTAFFGTKNTTSLRLKHCLAPGCPLLVQPTALNTDADNRLWVACRGGRILIMPDVTEEML